MSLLRKCLFKQWTNLKKRKVANRMSPNTNKILDHEVAQGLRRIVNASVCMSDRFSKIRRESFARDSSRSSLAQHTSPLLTVFLPPPSPIGFLPILKLHQRRPNRVLYFHLYLDILSVWFWTFVVTLLYCWCDSLPARENFLLSEPKDRPCKPRVQIVHPLKIPKSVLQLLLNQNTRSINDLTSCFPNTCC